MNVIHLSADDLDPDDAVVPGDLDFLKHLPRLDLKSIQMPVLPPCHTPKPVSSEPEVTALGPAPRRTSRYCHERQRCQRMVGGRTISSRRPVADTRFNSSKSPRHAGLTFLKHLRTRASTSNLPGVSGRRRSESSSEGRYRRGPNRLSGCIRSTARVVLPAMRE
jgi:hypothetical protein